MIGVPDMDPQRWRQVEELYHRALEFEAKARAAFLETACEGDHELRRQVESLIAQGDSDSPGPIDNPPWAPVGTLTTEATEIRWLSPGAQVGPYTIEAPLGAGGMGIVYSAIDTKLHRRVAIKLVSARETDSTTRRRFRQEATTASSLNHPHILTVHDVGEFDEWHYLVTEFVDGGTLKEWARAATRNWGEVVELLVGVADGLATAHDAGILHRDVKPTNILVAKNGHAKLADFGLARFDERARKGSPRVREDFTRSGMIVGTPPYMSPEQASGQTLDARSDIFSFGAVLYELLAKRPPFRGETALEVLQAIVAGTREPLGEDSPSSLRAIVDKALETDVLTRYQSMRDVLVDLKRVQQQISVGQDAERALERTRPPRPRTGRIAVVLITLLSALTLGIMWSLAQADYFWRNPLAGARTDLLTDFPSDEVDAAISPDGKLTAFLSDRSGSFDVYVNPIGTDQFVNITQSKIPTAVPAVIRRLGFTGDGHRLWISEGQGSGPYRLLLASVLGGDARPFLADAMEPAWSPDGSMVAYHTAEPGDPIFVADRSGGNQRRIFAGGPDNHSHHLTWSPDGRFLYFVKGSPTTEEMDIWRVAVLPSGPAEPERVTTHNAMVSYLGWLDGRTLIYVGTAQEGSGQWLYVLDVQRRIPHRVSSGINEQYVSVAVSTTQPRRLIASVATPTSSLWAVPISDRVQREADVTRLPISNARALSPRAAADYLLFLSSRGAGGDGLWTLKDNAVAELWKGTVGGIIAAPAISSDGLRICFSYRTRGRSHLYVMNSDGLNVRLLTDSFDVRSAASWSPDGKWVVVAGSNGQGTYVFKVSVDDGTAIRLTDTVSYNPVWSPTGQIIVYSKPLQGSSFLAQAITPDKRPVPLPDMRVSYVMGTPYRFVPDGSELIFVKDGPFVGGTRNFHAVNLRTGRERQLTDLKTTVQMRTFDVTHDGKQIVFDRLRQNSDIAVIDLPR